MSVMLTAADSARSRSLLRVGGWALIPALAIIAWAPVVTLWFVADDFQHLTYHNRLPGLEPFSIVAGGKAFYRPLSTVLTWNAGYALFGMNAQAYHLLSVLLQALAAFLLAGAVAAISGNVRIGWLTGALFAVFPLSTEPVAWLADQWDVWAAVCALGATWAFVASWKLKDAARKRWLLYGLGLLLALAAPFMKESALPLPLVLIVAALVAEISERQKDNLSLPSGLKAWGNLAWSIVLWSLPYFVPTLFFSGLRISGGGIGGYEGTPTDFQDFFWDAIVGASRLVLTPLNRSIFPGVAVQATGLVLGLAVLAGLALWPRRRLHLLLLAAVWWLAFLIPVLNLVGYDPQLNGNRLVYFPLMGFCILLGTIAGSLVEGLRRWEQAGWALAALVLLHGVIGTWVQLGSWQQASVQTRYILDEMGRLVMPVRGRVTFNTRNLPRAYEGTYVFWNGFEDAMALLNHQSTSKTSDYIEPRDLPDLQAPFTGNYNLSFAFSDRTQLYYVNEISGATIGVLPQATEGSQLWDYTTCGQEGDASWAPQNGTFGCAPAPTNPLSAGTGYSTFRPSNKDPNLLSPQLDADTSGATWLRLGVCARLGTPSQVGRIVGEWFWEGAGQDSWQQDQSRSFFLASTGDWRTYWTYIPAGALQGRLKGLRLDPVNDSLPVDIAWISVTVVP